MHACIHTCVHACMHATCIHASVYTYIYMYTHTLSYIHIFTCICIYVALFLIAPEDVFVRLDPPVELRVSSEMPLVLLGGLWNSVVTLNWAHNPAHYWPSLFRASEGYYK